MAPQKKYVNAEASGSKRAENYGKYFSEIDTFYRSFNTACNVGVKNGVQRDPTVSQFAGALMGMKDRDEKQLPKSWTSFAAKFPDVATMLRRPVAELEVVDGIPFRVDLPSNVPKGKSGLEVRNTSYVDGVPDVEDGKMAGGYEGREHEGNEVGPGGLIERKRKKRTAGPAKTKTAKGKEKASLEDEDDEDDEGSEVNFSELDTDNPSNPPQPKKKRHVGPKFDAEAEKIQ